MQAIHIKRYEHPESTGYAGSIEPEDRSWVLFIPNDGSMPQLFVEVEVPAEEGVPLNEDTPTIKGYAPAIYLDDRVVVKDDVDPPCPKST